MAEAGHHASRCYISQNGDFWLNSSAFYNSDGNDIAAQLNVLDTIVAAELTFLDGVTAGTVTASKAMVVDANKDIGTVRHLTISGNLVTGSTTLSETELGFLDTVASGTVTASKAVVVDANKDISSFRDVIVRDISATGSATIAGDLLCDRFVTAQITAAGGTSGATSGSCAVALTRADESTAISRPAQILIEVYDVQYSPLNANRNANVTFTGATSGSIVAMSTGWCLAETTASGNFNCITINAADETTYLRARTAPAHSDVTDGVLVLGSESASATWSA